MLRNVRICVFLVAECLQGLSNRCEGNPGWVFFWTAFLGHLFDHAFGHFSCYVLNNSLDLCWTFLLDMRLTFALDNALDSGWMAV